MTYNLIIPGEPVPQGRPRFSRQGGFVRTHNPPKSDKYKKLVMGCAARVAGEPLQGALEIEIEFYMPIRKSWSKSKKESCLSGKEKPTNKFDIDNLLKAVLDGCNGLLWIDDGQIVDVKARKSYSEHPRVELKVKNIGG